MNIILASTSKYRAQLLKQLALPFLQMAPLINEEELKESLQVQYPHQPQSLAIKLAKAKALSLSQANNLIIAGDQIVFCQGQILGKPGTFENAHKQLKAMQNQTHQLITAIVVLYQGKTYEICDHTSLQMRPLNDKQIENYLKLDQPYDCAGSYKLESHGIALFEKIESQDFTAIQGIPLIALANLLDDLNIPLFDSAKGD